MGGGSTGGARLCHLVLVREKAFGALVEEEPVPQRQTRGQRGGLAMARGVHDRQHAGGVRDDVLERAGREPRVEGKRDRAGAHRSEKEFDELGAVSDQHGHALARTHAESRQHARDAIHPLVELPVGGATLAAAEQVDDRHLVGHPRDGLVEEKAEIAPTIRIVHVTHAHMATVRPADGRASAPRVGEN